MKKKLKIFTIILIAFILGIFIGIPIDLHRDDFEKLYAKYKDNCLEDLGTASAENYDVCTKTAIVTVISDNYPDLKISWNK